MRFFWTTTALLIGGSCANYAKRTERQEPDTCYLLQAVLDAVIQPQDDDIHLRTACVRQYAGATGKVWVDARFFDQAAKQVVSPECPIPGYQVRFGKDLDPKPPGEMILLVSASAESSYQSHFFAQIENVDWPTRRPNTYGVSPCGSVSGTIRQLGTKALVKISPATRSDLE